jgi:hypothetical protein
MPRKKSGQPISLFSFQDIITSVTAILILILLIMTLELVTRKRTEAASSPAATREQLETAVARLEDHVASLRSRVKASTQVQASQRPRAEIEAELTVAENQLHAARVRLEEVASVLRESTRLRFEAVARREAITNVESQVESLERRSEADESDAEQIETANQREQERQAEQRQQVDEKPRAGTELVFNRPANSGRTPWLLEISSDGCVALKLGSNTRRALGKVVDGTSPFGNWLASLQARDDYCLLLVRPSGVGYQGKVESALEQAAIPYGVDFIGEDQAVRDGWAESEASGGAEAGDGT